MSTSRRCDRPETHPHVIGTTLNHFRITAKLGEGGMGAVYRAEDTRLGREVAIKVLPEAVATDPERLARFEREAQVLAALNHPNIAAIYEVGTAGDVHFLVMELAGGEDLAERLARGAMPVEEALPIALQLTEALEAAHANDIVHRDLKPANINVGDDGRVKVLDFGLAKALDPRDSAGTSGGADLSRSPTLTAPMTQAGFILGTAAYMSPEQARGKPADRRSDIWAFGCVLFEMLAGRSAFGGETVTDVLARILERPVDLTLLPPGTPAAVRRLLERCLEKDPSRRLRDIVDARWDLVAAGQPEPAAEPVGPASRPGSVGRAALVFAAGLALGAGVLWLAVMQRAQTAPPPDTTATRFEIRIPPSEPNTVLQNSIVALSPDGRLLAYTGKPADSAEMSTLFLRRLDRFEPEEIPDALGAYGPFFSADGEWLGYFTQSYMWKKPLSGGAAIRLTPVSGFSRGASWTADDRIFYSPKWFSGVYEIPAAGGEPTPVTTLLEGEKSHRFPCVLPDLSAVIFTVCRSDTDSFDDASIEARSLRTGERKVLVEGGSRATFLPPDRLLFGRDGKLFVATLDLARLEIVDSPVPVLTDVVTSPIFGSSQYAVSGSGTLAYLAGGPGLFDSRLVLISMEGRVTPIPIAPRPYTSVRYSPDGKRLAVRVEGGNGQIWIYDLERETLSRLTREWDADFPSWSPDGQSLAYVLSKGGTSDIVVRPADGTGQPTALWSGANLSVPQWAPDGRSLVFDDVDEKTGRDIWTLRLDGDAQASPYLQTAAGETSPVIAPDGRWLAYDSDESGRQEVYVQAYPVPAGRFQVSAKGGHNPVWSTDGRQLFFQSTDALMAVDVKPGDRFDASLPRPLFDLADVSSVRGRTGDVSPDGRKFVTATRDADWQPATRLRVILNFGSTLE